MSCAEDLCRFAIITWMHFDMVNDSSVVFHCSRFPSSNSCLQSLSLLLLLELSFLGISSRYCRRWESLSVFYDEAKKATQFNGNTTCKSFRSKPHCFLARKQLINSYIYMYSHTSTPGYHKTCHSWFPSQRTNNAKEIYALHVYWLTIASCMTKMTVEAFE